MVRRGGYHRVSHVMSETGRSESTRGQKCMGWLAIKLKKWREQSDGKASQSKKEVGASVEIRMLEGSCEKGGPQLSYLLGGRVEEITGWR